MRCAAFGRVFVFGCVLLLCLFVVVCDVVGFVFDVCFFWVLFCFVPFVL